MVGLMIWFGVLYSCVTWFLVAVAAVVVLYLVSGFGVLVVYWL